MGLLQFKRVTRDVESNSFDCGIKSINEYVKESYFSSITQQAYAYGIFSEGLLLGYYQIFFREINLTDFPDEMSDYFSEINDNKISSLHIHFIAIQKEYQRNKIGSSTIKVIIQGVKELSENWPIRVITLDSRNELVEWYKKEGFKIMKNNTFGQDGVSVAMYLDCFRFADDLEEYQSYIC